MPGTKFKITENTKRTSLKINGVLAVVEQEYDISLQPTITVENTLGFPAEPMDSFKYKIIKDDILSVNEGVVLVNFETDKNTNPNIVNEIKTIAINDSFYFSQVVPPNNGYDRITITEISGKGEWLLNNAEVNVGDVIFYYQLLNNLVFLADQSGSKNDYNVFKWVAGTVAFNYTVENTITTNTVSLGILATDSEQPEAEDFVTYEEYVNGVYIQKGIANGSFELNLDTSSFSGIGIDSENKIKLIVNGIETVYNTSGVFTVAGILSEYGEASIQCVINRKKPSIVINSILLTLTKIESQLSNVDQLNNQVEIIIPITTI